MRANPEHTKEACTAAARGISDALYVIGGKWKLPILKTLTEGPRRFNELQRLVEGISARILSNELKDLEMNGFVKRHVYAETPVIIEYKLTDYSDTLDEVLRTLADWGIKHRNRIRKSMQQKS